MCRQLSGFSYDQWSIAVGLALDSAHLWRIHPRLPCVQVTADLLSCPHLWCFLTSFSQFVLLREAYHLPIQIHRIKLNKLAGQVEDQNWKQTKACLEGRSSVGIWLFCCVFKMLYCV
uniref:Uncharacterized protein n=1 Tax=Micrurus spixii TaxID=129469 RepID=A0A2D4LZ20_9SAUR